MRETADHLGSIVDRTERLLRTIGDDDAAMPVLQGGWSRRQLIGHLTDSACNNHQRFVRTALAGSLDWPSYDQSGWVSIQDYSEAPWPLILDAWSAMNRLLCHVLAHLPPEAAGMTCRIGDAAPISLKQLAQDYVSHMLHHLHQIGVPET